MIVLIETEFIRFDQPELLSLVMMTSEIVVDDVLSQWGVVPGAAGTPWQTGRRAGEWLIAMNVVHLATDPHQYPRLGVGNTSAPTSSRSKPRSETPERCDLQAGSPFRRS